MWNIQKVVNKGDYLYAYVPEHPKCTKNGYVLMHRIIMENHLGRVLNTNEVVHHKNGNKKDNDISNLELLTNEEHSKLHGNLHGRKYVKLKCPFCGKIFDIPKNHSFLQRKTKCTFCSKSCSAKFYREEQLHGLTIRMKNAISENLLSEYIKYNFEDNSEETDLQQNP